jgi:hypothetical protein
MSQITHPRFPLRTTVRARPAAGADLGALLRERS